MDALQQHMLDSYRAVQRGAVPPPPPGRDDREVLRGLRAYLRARIPDARAQPPRP